MKVVGFNARCPFEIGDKIKVVSGSIEEVKTITDIACTHLVKTGAVHFAYELDNSGKYSNIEKSKKD